MRISPLYLTFLFEMCLLGLASFLRDLFLVTFFGDFIPKGENVELKQASVSKVGRGKKIKNGEV
jgi:hypothetical protein